MVEEMSGRLSSALALSNEASVNLGLLGGEALQDPHFYLVGRLLVKKKLSSQSFMAAIGGEEMRHILHGSPWYYNNSMLLLAEYDGLGEVKSILNHSLEFWVAVKGLGVALRNEKALTLIGGTLGRVLRFDQVALRRREAIQRIRVLHDTIRRIRLHQGCDKALLDLVIPGATPSGAGNGKVGDVGQSAAKAVAMEVLSFAAAPNKARVTGVGDDSPVFSAGASFPLKSGIGPSIGPSSLFKVKGFSAPAFAAIPKGPFGSSASSTSLPVASSDSHLSGIRRQAAMMLIQPGKRAKVVDSISPATGLELVVAPQLALETKDGRIIVSPAKNKKRGRPVGAKNRLKGDLIASVAIAERPKIRG
ncbi:hypothetical protein M0R45_018932 [Rubus argutus]|uniref:Uncharacterized protein n=1 Tax=Rubus argutus TaxID=59490 RepID=A0AAW1X4P7_RUBAR